MKYLLSLLLALAFAATFVLSPGASPASAQVHIGVPPEAARVAGCPTFFSSGHCQATIVVHTEDKKVEIRWERSTVGDFQSPELVAVQTIPVSFWPTCAEVVGSDKILIAGKDRDGDTRIERWTLPTPLVVTWGGGQQLQPQMPTDMEVVYEASAAGRDMVRSILKLEGEPSSALVLFFDSRDLYRLDWGSEPYELTPVLSSSVEPLLAVDFERCLRGEHAANGYVYVFSSPGEYGAVPYLVLMDQDKDGVIDSHGAMDWEAYRSAGMTSSANWVSQAGLPL